MSRYCGEDNADPVLRAAEEWRDRALVREGSIFSESALWSLKNIQLLHLYYVEAEDDGEGTFLDKFKIQLAETGPEVKQLAAEMIWLLVLCSKSIAGTTKKTHIEQIWSWSGQALPESHWLTTPVLAGIGGTGQGFNFNRWRELVFLIEFLLRFRSLSVPEQSEILGSGWRLSDWISGVPGAETRQLRHMLLFLLFPDDFERVFSGSEKLVIAGAFRETSRRSLEGFTWSQLDRELRAIRAELEDKYQTKELDFYTPPLLSQWKDVSFKASTKGVQREHVLSALEEIDQVGIPVDARSTTYDLVQGSRRYPPKLVLSLATKYASGTEYDRTLFSGGEKSQAFALLRSLGFQIERKDFVSGLVNNFLAQAIAADNLVTKEYPKAYRGLQVVVSFGKGNFARIPWISFLAPGQTTSKGIYPVYLYYREAEVLILAYGLSETNEPSVPWADTQNAITIRQFFQSNLDKEPERYGASFVFASYPVGPQLDPDHLTLDLDRLIEKYEGQFGSGSPTAGTETPEIPQEKVLPIAAVTAQPYTIEQAIEELFIERDRFKSMLDLWYRKKNMVLCGPPGVGKTFVSRSLAYALLKEEAPERVDAVQFHQSYSYEDFVQGYRPTTDGFVRKNGLFYQFCEQAREDEERSYVFIIDEINRGNLSKIFGELLMLIEADKRSPKWEVPLAYSATRDERFHVPPNVYLLGLMNTADRSLAVVDYALRRRFGFVQLAPAFGSRKFAQRLTGAGADGALISAIVSRMTALNEAITRDTGNLGPGFAIGHSFFCDLPKEGPPNEEWYRSVIDTEIRPLLEEYWFDNPRELEKWMSTLSGA